MRKTPTAILTFTAGQLIAMTGFLLTTATSVASPTTAPTAAHAITFTTGWTPLQEGQALGTIETDARHGANPSPHVLRIAVTKTAGPGEGRAGAVSSIQFPVNKGEWCDVTFTAVTDRGSIGLVFSLENADGKVLARTTLPEIGRGRGRRGFAQTQPTSVPVMWPSYLVSLHVRATDPVAHLVITPIEPTNIWLDALTLTQRQSPH